MSKECETTRVPGLSSPFGIVFTRLAGAPERNLAGILVGATQLDRLGMPGGSGAVGTVTGGTVGSGPLAGPT